LPIGKNAAQEYKLLATTRTLQESATIIS
jgi:hypothetical protein